MGWARCGQDSKGREIGYAIEAVCDHPGCDKKIDRGLGCACGGTHGEDEVSCEKYFCGEHLLFHPMAELSNKGWYGSSFVCWECWKLLQIKYQEEEDSIFNG